MTRRTDPNPSKPGLVPVRLRQTPSQREAVRVAMGASPGHEAATAWALTAAVVVTCFVVLGIAVSGC
jgi:hypothetical protein